MTFIDTGDSGHDLAGSAVAALKAVTFDECSLHRVQLIVLGQAFDGGDLFALSHDGERQTGENAPSVEMHSAGPTSSVVASFLRPG